MPQYRIVINTVTKEVEQVTEVTSENSVTYLPTNEKGEEIEWYVVNNLAKLITKLNADTLLDTGLLRDAEESERTKFNGITTYQKGTESPTVNSQFNYAVSIPPNYDNTKDYPVIFYFHGSQNGEPDGSLHDKVLEEDIMLWLQDKPLNMIVFAPQNPNNNNWDDTAINTFVEWALNTSEWRQSFDRDNLNALGYSTGANACEAFMNNNNNGGFTSHWRKFNTITLVGGTLSSNGAGRPRYEQINNRNVFLWLICSGGDTVNPSTEYEQWYNNFVTANPSNNRIRITKYTNATHNRLKNLPYRGKSNLTQEAITVNGDATYHFDRSVENYIQFIKNNPKPNI